MKDILLSTVNRRTYFLIIILLVLTVGQLGFFQVQSTGLALLLLLGLDTHNLDKQLKTTFHSWEFWAMVSLFLWVCIPTFSIGNSTEYIERLMVKLPFVILPFTLFVKQEVNTNYISKFIDFLSLIFGLMVLTIWITQQGSIELYKVGKTLDTPGNHIRFSVIIAFLWMTQCYFILYQKRNLIPKIILACLLFLGLHLLAVRTGLLLAYVTLIVTSIYFSIRKIAPWILGIILVGIAVIPLIAYEAIPSFHHKIDYMLWDVNQFLEGKGQNYGDSGRLASLDVGLTIFKQNPWVGVGSGQLNESASNAFLVKYPSYPDDLLPHNQFIFTAAHRGIIGLVLLLMASLLPLVMRQRFQFPYFVLFFANILTLFMIDHPLEGTIGVGLFFTYFKLGELLHQNHISQEAKM